MSINLIELAKNHFSDAVIGKIATSLNLDPNTARGVIGKVFPSLMGSFGDKAQTGEGAAQLFDAIKGADSGILDNLTETFTGDNSELIEKGQELLGSLLGGKLESLTEVLGNVPGLSTAKAGGLLGLLTPMLTGLLKKQVVGSGLNVSGLTSLLDDQKEHISASLGSDFLGKLGLGSFAGLAGGAAVAATGIASGAGDKVSGLVDGASAKVSGLAGGAAGAVAGIAGGASDKVTGLVDGASDKVTGLAGGAAGAVTGAASGAAGKVSGLAGGAAGAVTGAASGAAGKVSGAAGSIGSGAASIAGGGAAAAAATTQKAGGSGLLKLLPVLILGLLAFLGIKMCKKDDLGGVVTDTAGSAEGILGGLKDGVTDMGDKAVDTVAEIIPEVVPEPVAEIIPEVVPEPVVEVVPEVVPEPVVEVVPEVVPEAVPAFVPTPDAAALSDKAAALAQRLSSVQTPEGGKIDSLYPNIEKSNDAEFLYRIPFATGETGVPNSHQSALKAKLKQADPAATLVTIGYADVRGDDALNKKLSYGRAKEVGTWIKTTLGNNTNLESFSMGETDRFSKTEFSKNRAVEVWQVK